MASLERLITKIKGEPYKIQGGYNNRELFNIVTSRGIQLIRGYISKLFFFKAKGFFFKGRHVKIRNRHLINAGKNLILGDYVYLNGLSKKGITLGNNVTIERSSTIICTGVIANKGEGIVVGSNTGINANVFIGAQGGVSIGNYVIIGPGVKIFSENHNIESEGYFKNQGETRLGVEIKDNSWIGSGAIILDGVILESNTVVAAGSVVTKSFEGNCVIGGVPAKIIKKLT